MLKKILLALVIVMMFFKLSYSQTVQQTINLKTGFNFVAFTLKPSITATDFISQNPSVQEIYSYNASSGSFLSVSDGTLLSLNVGKGYIIKASVDAIISVAGTDVPKVDNIGLKPGFNLIGISKSIIDQKFGNVMDSTSIVQGMYKWNPSSGSFISVIRGLGAVDDIDPIITMGQAYFMNIDSDSVLNYDNGSLLLVAIQKYCNLTGKIIDSATKIGIQGIRIQTQATIPTCSAVTDTFGVYLLSGVPVSSMSSYTFSIGDSFLINGYSRYKQHPDVNVSVNSQFNVADIEMIPNLGSVCGNIYDSVTATGVPIRSGFFNLDGPINVNIVIPGVGTISSGVSNTNGDFLISNVPSGTYIMTIKHAVSTGGIKRFNDVNRSVTVTAGQTTDLGLLYISLITVTIKGQVKDKLVSDYKIQNPTSMISDYGISGAQVQATIDGLTYSKTVSTSDDGSYQMDVPVYSNYKFKVISYNYDYSESSVTINFPTAGNTYLTQTIFATPKTGNISGRLHLDSNNNGYYDSNDTVRIKDANTKYTTGTFILTTNYRGVPIMTTIDSSSAFTVSVPVGNYYITFDPPAASLDPAYVELNKTNYIDSNGNRIVTVAVGGTTNLNAVITKGPYLVGSISGRVVNDNFLPLGGYYVTVAGLNVTPIINDSTGQFFFDNNIPAGTYDLTFAKLNTNTQPNSDYSTYTLSGVSVTNGVITNVSDVVLYKNFSSITGVAYLEMNNTFGYQLGVDMPLSNIAITATATIGGMVVTRSTTTLSDGSYSLTNLGFGSYTFSYITTSSEGYTALPVTVTITSKNPYTQNISMQTKIGAVKK